MAKKKRQHEEEHENHERWLVTYADMITLLMVLFIVLFSMAAIDQKKFTQFKESLAQHKASESIMEGTASVIEGGQTDVLNEFPAESSQFDFPELNLDLTTAVSTESEQQQRQREQEALKKLMEAQTLSESERNNLRQVQEEMQTQLEAHNMQDKVQFRIDERGLIVSVITDKVLFDSGSASLRAQGGELLDAVGVALRHVPNKIAVEGHTDNVPIRTVQYPSNWELSGARAASVLRHLVDHKDIGMQNAKLGGYADTRPIAPNDTPEGRASNRRVEIVILKSAANEG